MDARTYQTKIEALAQEWEVARTPEDLREVLRALGEEEEP